MSTKRKWWQIALGWFGLWSDPNVLPDGYIQIGKVQLKKNTKYAPSGHPESENFDTCTIKPRSSDGQLKNSPCDPFCRQQIDKGLKDTDFEVLYINPLVPSEYAGRAGRVAMDDEVVGRIKWNYRRAEGCKDLCYNVLVVWVRVGTKVKTLSNGMLRVDGSELYLQIPSICQNATPQYEVP